MNNSRDSRRASVGKLLAAFCILVAFMFGDAQPPNVDVSQLQFNQAGISIAVNPVNQNNVIVASWNMDPTNSANRDVIWYSFNKGESWEEKRIPNPSIDCIKSNPIPSDPSIVFDRSGKAYYTHLRLCEFGREIVSAVSLDGGINWVPAKINSGTKTRKSSLAVGPDRDNPAIDRVYVGYMQISGDGGVQYVQSTTDGLNWSPRVRVSDEGNDGINIQLAVNDAGIVYAAWQGIKNGKDPLPGSSDIFFDVSEDGGQTWGTDSIVYTSTVAIFRDPFPATCGPRYCIPAAPDRGVGMFLSMEVDRSGGCNNNRIYMALLEQADLDCDPHANDAFRHDDTDVFVLFSDDVDDDWEGPIRVNDDPRTEGNSQFLPWLDVDQVTGVVAVGWYDTRNDRGQRDTSGSLNDEAEFFAAVSYDGGSTFSSNRQVSEGISNQEDAEPYIEDFPNVDFGDYVGVAIHDRDVYAAWADNSYTAEGIRNMHVYSAVFRVELPELVDACLSADPDVLWPPTGTLVKVRVKINSKSEPQCFITGVESNEPNKGKRKDWVITGKLEVSLRAKRTGLYNDRVYTIHVKCNGITTFVTVTVPYKRKTCTKPLAKICR